MRLKEIHGLPVIDPTAARKIGTVIDYQVDPAAGRVAALDINGVENGDGQRVLAHRIRRVGRNAVILTARGGSTPGITPEINERWLDTATLSGLEVMGDDGNRVGRVDDATFDQDSLEIDAYQLRSAGFSRLFGNRGRIQPDTVNSCSRELMLVVTGHLKETPAAALEDTTPLSMRLPLKADDRPPAPSYDQVDGQTVGAGGS